MCISEAAAALRYASSSFVPTAAHTHVRQASMADRFAGFCQSGRYCGIVRRTLLTLHHWAQVLRFPPPQAVSKPATLLHCDAHCGGIPSSKESWRGRSDADADATVVSVPVRAAYPK